MRGVCYCIGNRDGDAEDELIVGGLQRAVRACEHMATRDAWPQRQAHRKEKGGTQNLQHMQSGMASMHCNQSMHADRHNCREIQRPGGFAGREPHGKVEKALHNMSG